MRTPVNQRHLYRLTLGAACVYGLGVTGCSRPALDLGRDDPSAHTAVQERAAEAVKRSRQELIAQDHRAAKARGTEIARTPRSSPDVAVTNETPAPAVSPRSKFRMPVPRLLSSWGRDREADFEDPFLANAEKSSGKRAPAAEADPVQDFLREQRPIGVNSRASVVNFETGAQADGSELLSAPPATEIAQARQQANAAQKGSSARQRELQGDPAVRTPAQTLASKAKPPAANSSSTELDRKGTPAGEQRLPKRSAAAPFPAAEDLEEKRVAERRTGAAAPFPNGTGNSVSATPTAMARHKIRSAGNPLAVDAPVLQDEEEEVMRPAKQPQTPTGAEIAAILEDAHAATEQGEFTSALELVAEAQRLATERQYVFAKGEQQPADAIALIAHEIQDAERLSRGELADGGSRRKHRFSNASFTAAQHPEFSQSLTDPAKENGDADAAFGSTESPLAIANIAQQPVWPESKPVGMVDSDQLWQPNAGIASLPQKREAAMDAEAQQFAMEVDSQLAAAQSATGFVASTSSDSSQRAWQSAGRQSVAVELGAPTSFAPETLAFNHSPPSRLVAPPPLAIGDSSQEFMTDKVSADAAPSRGKSRVVWYAIVGALAGVVLLAFRRRAYGTQRSK